MMNAGAKLRRATTSAVIAIAGIVAVFLLVGVVLWGGEPKGVGKVQDEALATHRQAATFPAADEDYFRGMDAAAALTPGEVRGRNTWMVWTGGNDRFWNTVSQTTYGNFDLLKVLSSYPGLKFGRDSRFQWLGLINEPCFVKATGPNPQRYGLWLDSRAPGCAPDPFENAAKYPGVKIGARGKDVPVGSFYGDASGILGLRLFPNPDFDAAAQKKWDPVRYYTDPTYYNNKDLVRPYRVGMACSFCHVGPNPVAPPADPENPQFANLSGTVGAQYFWVDRIFSWSADPDNYLYQMFHTARPGALDTSLVSTDYINNPRTMNAVYNLGARLGLSRQYGKETLADNNLQNRQLPDFFEKPKTVYTTHVLKDGSDSVGALGALNRVFVNIGLFSEEWLLHFNAFVGGQPSTPFRIATARKNSSYWNATEAQTTDMAYYLVKAGYPHRLADAPGGKAFLADPAPVLAQGRGVFAERCARCHSSKLPPIPAAANPSTCTGPNYLTCWNNYWALSKTPQFRAQMRAIVDRPDFLADNFLSTDMRIPASLLKTNLCSPMAANALGGMIWDDFSSQTYKQLPSVGKVTLVDPIDGRKYAYQVPAGGRGYTRPASLVSLWSTSPYLLNNTVGHFEWQPSVEARMRSFDDGITQMLWPERRRQDRLAGGQGVIDRLSAPAYLAIPGGYLPDRAQRLLPTLSRLAPGLFVSARRPFAFAGTTAQGSPLIRGVSFSGKPLARFAAGEAVTGAGIPAGARVVRFDVATASLQISAPATVSGTARLASATPDSGVRLGPIPAGSPSNLLAAVELAPERDGFFARMRQDARLASLLLSAKHYYAAAGRAKNEDDRKAALGTLGSRLYAMSKCPDYVVNRGHYFGTDMFGEEPGLSDPDKRALIAFLKTF